jgi:hypothetical protein
VVATEDDAEMGEQQGRESDDDVHAAGTRVLKVHIVVRRCAFTDGRVTVPCVTVATPQSQLPPRGQSMSRRLTLLVFALLTLGVSACADVTAPEPSSDCPVVSGNGTRKDC